MALDPNDPILQALQTPTEPQSDRIVDDPIMQALKADQQPQQAEESPGVMDVLWNMQKDRFKEVIQDPVGAFKESFKYVESAVSGIPKAVTDQLESAELFSRFLSKAAEHLGAENVAELFQRQSELQKKTSEVIKGIAVPEYAKGTPEEAVQELSSFLTTMATINRMTPGKITVGKTILSSAAATGITTDEDTEGLADLLVNAKPEWRDTILGELATEPDDSTWEIKRKRMIEDVLLSLGFEGAIKLAKVASKTVSTAIDKYKLEQELAPVQQANDIMDVTPDMAEAVKPPAAAVKHEDALAEQLLAEAKASIDERYSVKNTVNEQAQRAIVEDEARVETYNRVMENLQKSREARAGARGSQWEATAFRHDLDAGLAARDIDRIASAYETYAMNKNVSEAQAKRTLRAMMEKTSPKVTDLYQRRLAEENFDPWAIRANAESFLAQDVNKLYAKATARETLLDKILRPLDDRTPEETSRKILEKIEDTKRDQATKAILTARANSIDYLKSPEARTVKDELLKTGFQSLIGGSIGYGVGDEEGAMWGALIGGTGPWISSRVIRPTISKAGRSIDDWATEHFGALISRPSHKIEMFGDYGVSFSKLLESAEQNISNATGKFIQKSHAAVVKLSKPQQEELIRVLQGAAVSKDAGVIAAQKELRGLLRNVAGEMHKAGLIDKDQLAKMLKDDKYWPRVYDEAKLASRAGRKEWNEVWTKAGWTDKKSLEQALEHVLHGSKKHISEFMALTDKRGGKYYLRKEAVERMYRARDKAKVDMKVRAGHLKKRTLLPENEEILAPFLVKNPIEALTMYGEQVMRQIESARIFGAKDELAESFFRGIENTSGGRAADFSRNIYYQMVHDSRSSMIAANLRFHPGVKRAMGQVHALMTLKLSMGQILNTSQTLVGAPVYLAKYNNPFKAYKIAAQGLFKTLGPDGARYAEATGAALESTIMNLAGSAHVQHSIFGKELTGFLRPVEWLNNPSKFLKGTGFVAVENFNRRLASNIGRVLFEDTLKQKQLIEAGKITNKKTIAKVHSQLYEMGIPYDVPVSKITSEMGEAAVNRAGLFLSDTVNYTNNATKMPYLARHPVALLFRQFKTFTFHHGAMVKEHVLKPAIERGNYGPLVNYLIGAGVFGGSIAEIRRWITGDDKDLTATEHLIDGITTVGSVGILYDTARQTTSQYGGDVAGFFGPAAGQAYKAAQEVKKVGTGQTEVGTAVARMGLSTFGGLPGKQAILEQLKNDNEGKRTTSRGTRSTSREGRSDSR